LGHFPKKDRLLYPHCWQINDVVRFIRIVYTHLTLVPIWSGTGVNLSFCSIY
jgi:hypothetical protein